MQHTILGLSREQIFEMAEVFSRSLTQEELDSFNGMLSLQKENSPDLALLELEELRSNPLAADVLVRFVTFVEQKS